jgi:hypothetical protein
MYSIQEEASTIICFVFDPWRRIAHAAADGVRPATGFRRLQLRLGNSSLSNWAIPICGEPAAYSIAIFAMAAMASWTALGKHLRRATIRASSAWIQAAVFFSSAINAATRSPHFGLTRIPDNWRLQVDINH